MPDIKYNEVNLFIGKIQEDKALLDETESHHLTKVLRLTQGDTVLVTDGAGALYIGKVDFVHHKKTTISIVKPVPYLQKRDYFLHIAVAPTKQIDRIEWLVEKSVELGIDEFSFIETFHSERRNLKIERMQKVALSAVKQSLKADVPKLNTLLSLQQWLSLNDNFEGQKFIAHCYKNIERLPVKTLLKPNNRYLFLIGPEGDFTPKEVQLAIEHGFKPISLGEQRMRTETAALSSVFFAHWLHQ